MASVQTQTPSSPVVHITWCGDNHAFLAVCADGSIWWLKLSPPMWTLVLAMNGKTY